MAVSEEVRSRCHVKHTLPRWPVDLNNSEICDSSNQMGILLSRRQKSWDILDQSAITYARTHKTPPHQVTKNFSIMLVYFKYFMQIPIVGAQSSIIYNFEMYFSLYEFRKIVCFLRSIY